MQEGFQFYLGCGEVSVRGGVRSSWDFQAPSTPHPSCWEGSSLEGSSSLGPPSGPCGAVGVELQPPSSRVGNPGQGLCGSSWERLAGLGVPSTSGALVPLLAHSTHNSIWCGPAHGPSLALPRAPETHVGNSEMLQSRLSWRRAQRLWEPRHGEGGLPGGGDTGAVM